MKIVFRADASIDMGTGHIMRCLTLAEALQKKGVACHFICREHQGNLLSLIHDKGFITHALAQANAEDLNWLVNREGQLLHAAWLGATQQQDVEQCAAILANIQPNWLVVDHYALDINWELALSDYYQYLMVIDDLADRHHHCDLLLDQTFGRDTDAYQSLVPDACTLLCGSQYALLRPEFAGLRSYSLQRRKNPKLAHLLITMGGVDKNNATGQVLAALQGCGLPEQCRITVVMGVTAPWIKQVQQQAELMPWYTEVKIGVNNMAELMANSDLAIGAAGATSWERCCLGLPTIIIVLADNQKLIASELEAAGAALYVEIQQIEQQGLAEFVTTFCLFPKKLKNIGKEAATITDGYGVETVLQRMEI